MKKGEITLMVCADYSKAFDTVQFKAALAKLQEMGFQGAKVGNTTPPG